MIGFARIGIIFVIFIAIGIAGSSKISLLSLKGSIP